MLPSLARAYAYVWGGPRWGARAGLAAGDPGLSFIYLSVERLCGERPLAYYIFRGIGYAALGQAAAEGEGNPFIQIGARDEPEAG